MREPGDWNADEKHVDEDTQTDPQLARRRAATGSRERNYDVSHEEEKAQTVDGAAAKPISVKQRPLARDEIVEHRHRDRDEVVEKQTERRRPRAPAKTCRTQHTSRDRLKYPRRRRTDFDGPVHTRVGYVEGARNKTSS